MKRGRERERRDGRYNIAGRGNFSGGGSTTQGQRGSPPIPMILPRQVPLGGAVRGIARLDSGGVQIPSGD